MLGVHVARALAIVGMLAVHLGPTGEPGVAGRLYALPHGRASLLFVVIAGAGVSLLASSPRSGPRRLHVTLVWRGVLLLPLGLLLQNLDHGANVILQVYALLFLLAPAVLRLSDRGLLALTAGFATFGPLVFLGGSMVAPEVFSRTSTAWGDGVGELLHGLLLSGSYPLVTWAAPFLLGIWLGRRELRERRVQIRVAVWGAVAGVGATGISHLLVWLSGGPSGAASVDRLLISTAHSQMPLWLLGGTGIAVAVLGLTLLVSDRLPRLAEPFAATGRMALTIYVGHLVVLHVAAPALVADRVAVAAATMVIVTALLLGGSTAWMRRFGVGPLERLVRPPRWATVDPARRTQERAAPGERAAPVAAPDAGTAWSHRRLVPISVRGARGPSRRPGAASRS